MSLLKKIGRGLEKLAKPVVRGYAATVTGGASEALFSAYQQGRAVPKTVGAASSRLTQGMGDWTMADPMGAAPGGVVMGSLPRVLPQAGQIVTRLGQAISRTTIIRSANVYCRRHPAWCAALPGGIAAVVDLVGSGSLPAIKRRRARGITAGQLSAFRRVSGILNKYAKTPPVKQATRRKC